MCGMRRIRKFGGGALIGAPHIVRTVQRAPADVCSPYGGRYSCGAISPVRVRYRRAKRRLDSVANTTRMPRVHSAARTTNHVVE